jgi:NADH dehydrogenase FAD-containing subunit
MRHMNYQNTKPYEDWFWDKNRLRLIHDTVDRVDPSGKKLHFRKRGTVSYDGLVIACGDGVQ